MRVFSLTTGADTAGIAYGLSRAFRDSDVTFRAMVASTNYIDYPIDVPYDRLVLEQMYDEADLVLLHNTTHGHRFYDDGQRKPIVLMHHGRGPNYASTVAEARRLGMVQVGSTLDLSVHARAVTWCPPPVDIAAMRARRERHDALTIGHAPTDWKVKGTGAFVAAMTRLRERHHVEMRLIEGLPWAQCLDRKGSCDVFYDQAMLGYGSNAIEAWAMGIPVLAGVVDQRVRAAMLERWGVLPFYETSEATIERDLEAFISDDGLRAEYAARGMAHVERWHAESVVAQRFAEAFERAGPTRPGGRLKRRMRRGIENH